MAKTDSEHGLNHVMVLARLRLRVKAVSISNRPTKFDTAKLKTVALEHLRLDLRNHFEGLHLDEDVSRRTNGESSNTRSHTPARQILEEHAVAVGNGSLVKRASAPGEDSKCTQSAGSEKTNNESTTSGSQRLLEGNGGRDR